MGNDLTNNGQSFNQSYTPNETSPQASKSQAPEWLWVAEYMEVPKGQCTHKEYAFCVCLPPFLALCVFPIWLFLSYIFDNKPINKMLSEVLGTFKELSHLRWGCRFIGQNYRWPPGICNWHLSCFRDHENSQPLVSELNGIA